MFTPYPRLRLCRPVLATFLLLLYLPACTTWHVGTPTPAAFIERERPASVRVALTNGSVITVTSPSVIGDSLTGFSRQSWRGIDSTSAITVALSDVSSVAVRRTATGRTLLAVAGGLVLVTVVAWVVECEGKSGWESLGCP